LEKVIQSRLVETFVSVTVPDPPNVSPSSSPLPPAIQRTRAESAPRTLSSNSIAATNHSATSVRKASKMSRPNSTEASKAPSLPRAEAPTSIRSSISMRKGTPVKTNGAPPTSRTLSKAHKPSASVPPTLTASQLPSPPASPASPEPPQLRTVPNYISPIHQPSTNPSFVIDAQSSFEFAPWTDLSANTIKVELWAKTYRNPTGGAPLDSKGKQKETLVTDRDDLTREGAVWHVLEQWNVTLADLVPLTPEVWRLSHIEPHMFSNCSTSWRLTPRAFRPIPFSYLFPHPHKLSICPPVHFRRYIHTHAHLHRLRTALSQRPKFANLSTFPTKLNQHVFRRRARILNTLAGANHAKQVPELRVRRIYCSKYYC
jgi:hypothetical protein